MRQQWLLQRRVELMFSFDMLVLKEQQYNPAATIESSSRLDSNNQLPVSF
jgi:hypothetical protein